MTAGLSDSVEITFDELSLADAGRNAADLADHLAQSASAKSELHRQDGDAMDFGSSLILFLGTPAVAILARGIAEWIKMRGDPAITIKTKKGSSIRVPGSLTSEQRYDIIMETLTSDKL